MSIKPGSILLCISDLPVGLSKKELKAFVLGGIDRLRGRTLRMTPAISNCTILRLTHPATGAMSHQGLIAVQPARLALDLIEALRLMPLRGSPVKVCRYRHSSFEAGLPGETKSIGDLLGISEAVNVTECPTCKLDLVVHTGDPILPGDPIAQQAAPLISGPILIANAQRATKTSTSKSILREKEQPHGAGGAFAH